jgi:thymidine phosphorylase
MLLAGFPEMERVGARAKAEEALASGRALERMVRLVEAQGGDASIMDDPGRFRTAPERANVEARDAGTVLAVEPRALGQAVVTLGGGRRRLAGAIHLGVGFELAVAPGERVERGDPLGTVHALDAGGLSAGEAALRAAVRVGEGNPDVRPLVSHRVTAAGAVAY